MIRDFSENAEKTLLSSMDGILSDNWTEIARWFPDWSSYQPLAIDTGSSSSFHSIKCYHQAVLKKAMNSREKTVSIFQEAREIDSRYAIRLTASAQKLILLHELLISTADVISPANGCVIPEDMITNLSALFSEFIKQREVMNQITSPDGLSAKEAEKLDPTSLQRVLELFGSLIVAVTPNVKAGETLEIPIGLDTVVYCKNEYAIKTGSPYNLDLVIEDQKLKLDNFGVTAGKYLTGKVEFKGGEVDSVSIGGSNTNVKINDDGQMENETSVKIGNDTYTVKFSVGVDEIKFEESVCTETDEVSVTTAIGITKSTNDNNGWKPIPVPVPVVEPVTDPATVEIPSLDVDWEAVGEAAAATAIVVGGVLLIKTVIVFTTGQVWVYAVPTPAG